jgi:hypothetical protein
MEAFAVILVIIFLFLLIFYLNKRKVRNQFTSTISVATNAAPDYSQQPSPIKRLKPKKPFAVNVAGTAYDNDDGSSRQKILKRTKVGEPITLCHVPIKEDRNS